MAFPNEIVISGTLCNVEYKTSNSGNSYMTAGLKVYQGKDKEDGWFDVIAFNNERNALADKISDCFGGGTKSLPVIIKGKLEVSTYDKKDGTKGKSTKIIVDELGVSVVFGSVTINNGVAPTPPKADTTLNADEVFNKPADSDLPF